MSASHDLRAPVDADDLVALTAGDMVRLSGTIYTARDAAHQRMADALDRGDDLPFDPAGQILYFTGPAPARPGRPLGPAGPTTASRMDPWSPLLIARGLRLMIGKGRRGDEVRAAMRAYGCVYCSAVEGAAALIADRVVAAEVIAYADLGPEAVHRLEVDGFPVTVVNDLDGNDLYEQGRQRWRRDVRGDPDG